jgi:hypothetical protein
MEYYIKTEDWKHIFRILSKRTDIRTGNETKLRLFVEAIWFMARTGCQWRLLPKEYGSWRAIHRRFKNWSEKGVWSHLFVSTKVEADREYSIIDTTIVILFELAYVVAPRSPIIHRLCSLRLIRKFN